MRRTRAILGICVLLLVVGYNLWQQQAKNSVVPTTQSIITPTTAQVLGDQATTSADFVPIVKVVDGDTFAVEINGKKETIRLIGIDTPEVVDPRKPVQCFGKEASNKAKEILTNQKVRLESDPTQSNRDKYGRILRYAFLPDGTFFNKFMIQEGFAHEYTYQIPYIYQEEFKNAEKQARESGKGLWADNACLK